MIFLVSHLFNQHYLSHNPDIFKVSKKTFQQNTRMLTKEETIDSSKHLMSIQCTFKSVDIQLISLQFEYNNVQEIQAVAVQGSGAYTPAYFIYSYIVSYSLDGIYWRHMSEADRRARVCS